MKTFDFTNIDDTALEQGCDELQDMLAESAERGESEQDISEWRAALEAGLAEMHRRGMLTWA